MDRPLLAMRIGAQGFLAALGGFLALFVLIASGGTPVREVLALMLLFGIPTAAVAERAVIDLGELRSEG